jgi:hypothetical protein
MGPDRLGVKDVAMNYLTHMTILTFSGVAGVTIRQTISGELDLNRALLSNLAAAKAPHAISS